MILGHLEVSPIQQINGNVVIALDAEGPSAPITTSSSPPVAPLPSSLPAPPSNCSRSLINDNPDPDYEPYVLLSEESEEEEDDGKEESESSDIPKDLDTNRYDEGNGYVICQEEISCTMVCR